MSGVRCLGMMMKDDYEDTIYYNPPNIPQSTGGEDNPDFEDFPGEENINLRGFIEWDTGRDFLVPGQPGFEELRALTQLMGHTYGNYWRMDITWSDLRGVLETAGIDVSQLVTREE